jgi:peroxiredoxin
MMNKLLFIIACTDTGGDTNEKAINFHSKRQLPFLLTYDTEARVHKSFGFTGVPGLVIIDKKGKMRFKHEGYNQAENLEKTLIPLLKGLLKE